MARLAPVPDSFWDKPVKEEEDAYANHLADMNKTFDILQPAKKNGEVLFDHPYKCRECGHTVMTSSGWLMSGWNDPSDDTYLCSNHYAEALMEGEVPYFWYYLLEGELVTYRGEHWAVSRPNKGAEVVLRHPKDEDRMTIAHRDNVKYPADGITIGRGMPWHLHHAFNHLAAKKAKETGEPVITAQQQPKKGSLEKRHLDAIAEHTKNLPLKPTMMVDPMTRGYTGPIIRFDPTDKSCSS